LLLNVETLNCAELVTELVFISPCQGQELCYLVAINTSRDVPLEKPFYLLIRFEGGTHIF